MVKGPPCFKLAQWTYSTTTYNIIQLSSSTAYISNQLPRFHPVLTHGCISTYFRLCHNWYFVIPRSRLVPTFFLTNRGMSYSGQPPRSPMSQVQRRHVLPTRSTLATGQHQAFLAWLHAAWKLSRASSCAQGNNQSLSLTHWNETMRSMMVNATGTVVKEKVIPESCLHHDWTTKPNQNAVSIVHA